MKTRQLSAWAVGRTLNVRPRPHSCALVLLLAALCACHPARLSSARAQPDTVALRHDVVYLASDALEGRGTGTSGFDSAAAYVARRWRALGLQAVMRANPDACTDTLAQRGEPACGRAYLQRFNARSVAAAHAGLPGELPTENVVALLRGSDPALANEYVVIGAHLDHLGRNAFGALDPQAGDAIRNGADDNASGSATVLEMARMFAEHPPRRSLIFVHFSGEELGLLGSQYFVEHPPVPQDSIVAMINFDMVGRLRDRKLLVYGLGTAEELPGIVDSANIAAQLDLRKIDDGFGPSDHSSFYAKGIPVLHIFTDTHMDYHRATDDVEKLNIAGMGRIVSFAMQVARSIADRPGKLTVITQPQPVARASMGDGESAYFGSVPDMSAVDVKGVRFAGVSPGSPADQAGAREGDVLIEFGGKPIADLYAFSDALHAHAPGDTVTLVVLRDGVRKTLTAVLRSRSSP